MKNQAWALKLLRESRVAHLATSREGRLHVIPICYVLDRNRIYSSIDEKPKRVIDSHLRRVLNINSNPRVVLIADFYSEDWDRLQYVIVEGLAKMLRSGREHKYAVNLLRRKYKQYRSMQIQGRPIIRIRLGKLVAWRSSALQK